MEDLSPAPGSPALQDNEEPQGLADPGDPLQPGIEEEDQQDAPLADPTADVDAFEDEEAPETVQAMQQQADGEEDELAGAGPRAEDSDAESELEELNDEQFEDFDPSALNIPDMPTQVDETNVGLIGVHKRKRTEQEKEESRKKRKEGKRDKPKRQRKNRDEDDDFEGGVEIEGKRSRKGKGTGEKIKGPRRPRTPEDEELLSPEEREYCLRVEHELYYSNNALQAVVELSTAKWMPRSKPTSPRAGAQVSTWKQPPTPRSRTCAYRWPKPARPMLKPAPEERLQLTSSRFCPR